VDVYGDFRIEPQVYCTGDDLTFNWDIRNVKHVRVVGATGNVIVEGSNKEKLVGRVVDSDIPLDVLVVWTGDGKEYSARKYVPDVAASKLTLLNANNDTWIGLAGASFNNFDVANGAWTSKGQGASKCCPHLSCETRGTFSWDGTTLTVDPSQECRAPFLKIPSPDCRIRDSTREENETVFTLKSSQFQLGKEYSPRVRILGLRNTIGVPFTGASVSATALGVIGLAPHDEAQFAPVSTLGVSIDVQPASPIVFVRKQVRETFFIQSDPLSEECPLRTLPDEPDCTRRNGALAHPELCANQLNVNGLVGLLRCLP
jgi:hypothetical protein